MTPEKTRQNIKYQIHEELSGAPRTVAQTLIAVTARMAQSWKGPADLRETITDMINAGITCQQIVVTSVDSAGRAYIANRTR